MDLKPLARMWERVDIGRQDSDTTLFFELMYLGEMLTKLIAAGLVSAIEDDRDRSRYRFLYSAVRANGIGDWAKIVGETLRGPALQHLNVKARIEQRELTQKCGPGTWQFDAVDLMHACLESVDPNCDPLPARIDGERWVRDFTRLRNKTRAHGAPLSHVLSSICPRLEKSLRTVADNYSLFQRDWAYLYRNLSGKYRVTTLGGEGASFEYLKRTSTENLSNGVYVTFDRPVRVELVESTVDASDFFFANGGFNERHFELLSYASGQVIYGDAAPYISPVGPLPASETQGLINLDVQGNCFGNLPPIQSGYVQREILQEELLDALRDDRHPIVTLIGRGGIGKTSLAIASAHDLTDATVRNRFDVMLWFSARDLDLLPQGPKLVKPSVLTIKDVAREFTLLLDPERLQGKAFNAEAFLAECLTTSPFGPMLLVLDNFETLANPIEFYKWLDTYVRFPNKILITTRQRDFKGDYPIDVPGMLEDEFNRLITSVSTHLGIAHLITDDSRQELFRESDGHPYVLKILLGEVAKAKKVVAIRTVFAV